MGGFLTEYAKNVSEKYESFLQKCFENCGYDSFYISEHPEEFHVSVDSTNDCRTYFHIENDTYVELFMICQHRDYEMIGSGADSFFWKCVYSYEVTYNDERRIPCQTGAKEV